MAILVQFHVFIFNLRYNIDRNIIKDKKIKGLKIKNLIKNIDYK